MRGRDSIMVPELRSEREGPDAEQRRAPASEESRAGKERATRHQRRAAIFLAIGLALILLVLSPLVDHLSDTNLVFHMLVEHPGFIAGGFLSSLAVENLVIGMYASGRRKRVEVGITSLYVKLAVLNHRLNKGGRLSLPIVAFLLAFWQLPYYLDLSELNLQVHETWHLSLISIGVLLFLSSKAVSRQGWVEVGLLFAFSMFGFAFLMISGFWFYRVYPLWQQQLLGTFMFVLMPLIWITIIVYAVRVLKSKMLMEGGNWW